MKIFCTPKTLWRCAFAMWGIALCGILYCYGIPWSHDSDLNPAQIPIPDRKISRTPQQLIPLSQALQSPPFALFRGDRIAKLPDLKNIIVYYGCNGRPDRTSQQPRIQFGIRGNSTVHCAPSTEKVFLRFDFRANRWIVEDKETPLGILFKPFDANVEVVVELQDGNTHITTPEELHKFSLAAGVLPVSHGSTSWTIGSFPVNPAILEHFGASWYGKDLIIQTLGGKEMEKEAASERIEFNLNNNSYAIFVQPNDYLAFIDNRWEKVSLGEKSAGNPLLQVRNIDDSTITFHLWDSDGSHQLPVLLRKKTILSKFDPPAIRILGMRSPKSIATEILGKKIVMSPNDWLIVSQNDVTIVDSEETLENFIQGQLKGNLLAFEGIEKIHHEQSLVGTFFDSTRTQSIPLTVPMYRSWAKPDAAQNDTETGDDGEDADDDEVDEEDDLFDEDEEIEEEHSSKQKHAKK